MSSGKLTIPDVPASPLAGKDFFSNPYPAYERLRAEAPAIYDPARNCWLVSRFADVETLLADLRTTKRFHTSAPTPFEQAVLSSDPPDHTRTRALLSRAFAGPALARIDARIDAIAEQRIEAMASRLAAGTSCDLIAEFALPLPMQVICDAMGIPLDATDELHRWSSAFLTDETVPQREALAQQYTSMAKLTAFYTGMVEERRKALGNDLISDLIKARVGDDRLSDEELVGNCILLLIAGHETTVNLLGNGLYLLLSEPSRFAQVCASPLILRTGVEEMLRYEAPVQLGTFRLAKEEITLGDVTIPAGAAVTLLFGSANRDPAVFRNPDVFDMSRTPNRHLAFGHGPHRCVGAAIGRAEARIGFTRLAARLPTLRLASNPTKENWLGRQMQRRGWMPPKSTAPAWRSQALTRGLQDLWVRV
jgi:cytochrome P450